MRLTGKAGRQFAAAIEAGTTSAKHAAFLAECQQEYQSQRAAAAKKVSMAIFHGTPSAPAVAFTGPATLAHRRAAFVLGLRERLHPRGVGVIAADIGQLPTHLLWMLTLQLPSGAVITLQAPLPSQLEDPFAPEICHDVAMRVLAYLPQLL